MKNNPSRLPLQWRTRPLILAVLSVLFGLHAFRVLLPTVMWYLGGFLGPEQLALYALVLFTAPLLAPVLAWMLGRRAALAFAILGLAAARLALQWVDTAPLHLATSSAGLIFFGLFIPLWIQSPTNRDRPAALPVLAVAFPLAFMIDTATRTLFMAYDLVWMPGLLPALGVAALVLLVLVTLWREYPEMDKSGKSDEPVIGRAWPILGLGPFLYLAFTLAHNPSALAVASGLDDVQAHTLVNGFSALGALACLMAAAGKGERGWLWALISGFVLIASLAAFTFGVGPAWPWYALATLAIWASLGWLLAGAARVEPLRGGLWRTSLFTFLALLILLAIVFVVLQYNLGWLSPVAGAVLMLAAAWGARNPTPGIDRAYARAGLMQTAVVAVALLVAIGQWAARSPAPQPSGAPDEGNMIVMTYNIHQGIDADMRMDLDAIARVISENNPDVVALNEVNRARPNNGFVDTLFFLSHRLGLPFVFGGNSPDGQYGNALLSRYPILEWDNTHYAVNTTEVRGLLRVVVQAPGGPIAFYATHLDHIGSPDNARRPQLSEALAVWGGAERSVLLGDLNAEPARPELQPLYDSVYTDALAATGNTDVFTFWDETPRPGRRIDYIFLTPDLRPERTWVVEDRASDHLPVLVEIWP